VRRAVEWYGWLSLAATIAFALLVRFAPGRPEANLHPCRRPSVGPGTY
jgi:hypothetical protein